MEEVLDSKISEVNLGSGIGQWVWEVGIVRWDWDVGLGGGDWKLCCIGNWFGEGGRGIGKWGSYLIR